MDACLIHRLIIQYKSFITCITDFCNVNICSSVWKEPQCLCLSETLWQMSFFCVSYNVLWARKHFRSEMNCSASQFYNAEMLVCRATKKYEQCLLTIEKHYEKERDWLTVSIIKHYLQSHYIQEKGAKYKTKKGKEQSESNCVCVCLFHCPVMDWCPVQGPLQGRWASCLCVCDTSTMSVNEYGLSISRCAYLNRAFNLLRRLQGPSNPGEKHHKRI